MPGDDGLAKEGGVAPQLAREERRMSSGDRPSVVLIGEDEEEEAAQEPGVVVDSEHNVEGHKGDCRGTQGVEAGSTPDH